VHLDPRNLRVDPTLRPWFSLYLASTALDPVSGRETGPNMNARVAFPNTRTVTLYPGQPDPKRANHFTIRYETDQGGGTIDGWFKYEGYLVVEVRDGPAQSD
jgi:hypothetical protein